MLFWPKSGKYQLLLPHPIPGVEAFLISAQGKIENCIYAFDYVRTEFSYHYTFSLIHV